MGAIFISYTGRDPEGDAWADRLEEWFTEWKYGYFRDKSHSRGVKAGDDWRQTLYRELDEARAMVCLCSERYESSPWCVGEVAIAVKDGKTVIPIQLAKTAEELKSEPLPLLLQAHQAIQVPDAVNPSPERLAEVRQRLRQTLQRKLKWRDLQTWDATLPPYPGLPAFEEPQAPVFFGRDVAIEAVVERLSALALRPQAFLLLLGASGYGKSSLVRAGVVPRLKGDGEGSWTVLPPFTPGDQPFKELERAVVNAGGVFDAADPLSSLRELQRQRNTRLLLVIDQFEELLSAGPKDDGQADEAETFQTFLRNLLRVPKAGLLVLATMRTDFLAPLQTRWPALTGMAKSLPLEPIEPADFGDLITGPADRSKLTLEPGLKERLVEESGGRDALPLLAFTLEKLWRARERRGVALAGTRPGEQWDLTLDDYKHLGGVAGAVSTRAKECWDPQTSGEEERAALREAFLDHLVSVSGDGQEAKRAARLEDLPPASLAIVRRLVDDRLLVLKEGSVEIAHEALLRTWEPLVRWIEESKVERLQALRVKRLGADLTPEAPERLRRQALEQLAALAAAGGSEQRAVRKEGREPLQPLLGDGNCPLADRQDAALVLALIGAEQPLRDGLADTAVPVALRRRAAESLGLLARRSGDRDQRQRIAAELEGWLRSDALNLLVVDAEGWAEHDARLPLLQGASRGLQLAASADLPLFGSGEEKPVPMLTLTALEEGSGLRIRTEVVEVPVWTLPLPGGERLELVVVPEGEAQLGSPPTEHARQEVLDWFAFNRDGCRDGVDVEAPRRVWLEAFALVRQPISQGQWRAVVEAVGQIERELEESPGAAKPESLWDQHGQPGELAVESVSWQQSREWLQRLNRWLQECWSELGGSGQAPQLALPSENQWEGACRAGAATPFHFGDTLDASWARYGASFTFGRGRKRAKTKQPGLNGASGLVNRWGLAELHGQLYEWCEDSWHPNPVGEGHPEDGEPWREEDGDLVRRESGQRGWKLLRGGSWILDPLYCRAAFRDGLRPANASTLVGFRPCCLLPPGSLLGP
jgi:formylglycine-generating enzyme required for sulfatase activity/energy-coupling factor transporter ATP-binding protein EcfA2